MTRRNPYRNELILYLHRYSMREVENSHLSDVIGGMSQEQLSGESVGTNWHQCINGAWNEGTIERVTRTSIILTDGTRISKKTHRDQHGWCWLPPSPSRAKEYETYQRELNTSYVEAKAELTAALAKVQELGGRATALQLRVLATQLEVVVRDSEIK